MKKRATAPNVKVSGKYRDTRAEMLKDLEEQDKGFAYCYLDPEITQAQLERGGYELVKDEKGDALRWREDVIAKRPLEDFIAEREAETEASADAVKQLYCRKPEGDVDKHGEEYWKKNSAGKRVAKRKDPSEIENHGGM